MAKLIGVFFQLIVAKSPKMSIHLNNDSHVKQNNSNITPESNKSDNLPSRFIELAVMAVKLGGVEYSRAFDCY
jgi:hypothetical protein